MDDEPLKDWAERRDANVGRLRAAPVVPDGAPKASHLNPDAPRAIERWNDYEWESHGFAANLAEAKAILYPEADELPAPALTKAVQTHCG
ncbi:DUF6087 family protein [Streptomyces sp. NPDC005355]|uniref:DUF6087 family protein n=1 Tax=Streptomyces sp. NPDC005355 TaxID=3157038 RepID=UPI0033BF1077